MLVVAAAVDQLGREGWAAVGNAYSAHQVYARALALDFRSRLGTKNFRNVYLLLTGLYRVADHADNSPYPILTARDVVTIMMIAESSTTREVLSG